MTLESAQACLDAVGSGFGMTWVSCLPFLRGEAARVVPVRIRGIRFKRKLYLIYRHRAMTPVACAFKEWLLRELCLAHTPPTLASIEELERGESRPVRATQRGAARLNLK
jgi:DNA-binding transcriptional LysR family regulator